jgi:uncharacterized membrane protein YhaH (DUF805 family)
MNWKELFLVPQGRAGRQAFLIGAAGLIVAGMALNLIPVLGPLAGLALIYPWTCLLAKRLHDFGRSGWLVLVPAIPTAVSGVLALVTAFAAANAATMGAALAGAGLALTVSGAAVLISVAFLVWAAVKPGDAHANRFGPPAPPLALAV